MGARTRNGYPGIYNSSALTLSDGDGVALATNSSGILQNYAAYLQAGEDITNDVMKVEQRFSYVMLAADAQVKAGAGFLHALTFAQADAAPTAGTIIAYDSLTEANTKIFDWSGITTAVFVPFTVILDVSFGTGLYLGFTTTADVNVTVSYR